MSKHDKKGMPGPAVMDLPVKLGTDDGLPEWFHGIMSRRESEDLLKNKEIGHFIIRLSQRTFGYILSYRGKERCRHFIINQLQNGELVVSGDSCSHESLPALISHYQDTPIWPFGEKLAQLYIKFSEINPYDSIQPANVKPQNGLSKPKSNLPKSNKGGNNHNRRKQSNVTEKDIAPPLPERSNLDDDNDQTYSLSKREAKEDLYSKSTNADVLYSLVKDPKINQNNIITTSTPEVIYSEVKGLPSALGHLQSSSKSLNQEAMTFDTRTPRLINSLKEHSECEVLEMRFATSVQTINSKTLSGPFFSSGSSFQHPMVPSHSETEVYEQIPFRGIQSTNEYPSVDQLSNYSLCSTNIYDHISTRTSKEVTSREMTRKVALTSAAEENAYETIATRDISKPAGKKQYAAKAEKPKKFFFGDKKK